MVENGVREEVRRIQEEIASHKEAIIFSENLEATLAECIGGYQLTLKQTGERTKEFKAILKNFEARLKKLKE